MIRFHAPEPFDSDGWRKKYFNVIFGYETRVGQTVSVGLALAEENDSNEGIISRADDALCQAKSSSRNYNADINSPICAGINSPIHPQCKMMVPVTPPNIHEFYPAEMSVYTYKRPGWMKLAQQKRVNFAQRYRAEIGLSLQAVINPSSLAHPPSKQIWSPPDIKAAS
jgi:hypothetical protein